jgi:small subunit ribosomal protein S20
MAITASAKKAVKRSSFLRERNLAFKLAMKKAIKTLRRAVADGVKGADLKGLLVTAYSTIDKARQKNIIHKNNAARKKSRLNKLVKAAS